MDEHRPQLRIIAGPNGSGKTTIVREFLPRYISVPNFVNAEPTILDKDAFERFSRTGVQS